MSTFEERPGSADFAERLAAPTPTPGGGAAAARVGKLATSLVRMVTGISLEKAPGPHERGDDGSRWAVVERIAGEACALGERFADLETEDMAAFEGLLAALRLPRSGDEERERRRVAIANATVRATETPLRTLEASLELLAMVRELLDLTASIRLRAEADLGGALEFAHAAFRGAEANVRVNLPGLRKEARGEQLEQRWRGLAATFDVQYETSRQQLARRLQG